jgi:nucleoid DNA-binding protein
MGFVEFDWLKVNDVKPTRKSKTIKCKHLVVAAWKKSHLPKHEIGKVIDDCLDIMFNALVNKEEVSIEGFGAFKVVYKAARWGGRNPKRPKELCFVSARHRIKFVPFREFSRYIQQHCKWNAEEYARQSDYLKRRKKRWLAKKNSKKSKTVKPTRAQPSTKPKPKIT